MKDEINKITLFCINCNEETAHTVQYIGSYLRSVSCDVCTKKIEIDRRHLRTVFAEDFIDRILTKPHRMNEDMKKAFATLTPFFPKRLIREPLQVLRDIYEVLKKDTNKKDNGKTEDYKDRTINAVKDKALIVKKESSLANVNNKDTNKTEINKKSTGKNKSR